MKRRFVFLVLALLGTASLADAQVVAGCVNGSLLDPAAFVRSLQAGFAPSQWPAALPVMKPQLAKYGIDVKHSTCGTLRPRVFLPTHPSPFIPDGDFNHTVDIIDETPQGPRWQYLDYGGGYVPYPCGTIPPPPPPPPPPDDSLIKRVELLERHYQQLLDQIGGLDRSASAELVKLDNRVKVLEGKQDKPFPQIECRARLAAAIPISCQIVVTPR